MMQAGNRQAQKHILIEQINVILKQCH